MSSQKPRKRHPYHVWHPRDYARIRYIIIHRVSLAAFLRTLRSTAR